MICKHCNKIIDMGTTIWVMIDPAYKHKEEDPIVYNYYHIECASQIGLIDNKNVR